MKDQIWLIGFMGTGKSRTARPLAAALDWRTLDTDDLVIERAGETIEEIFSKGGEAAFRVLESEVVEAVAENETNVVVATGGGAVLAEANRNAMRRRGFIVCLEARPETIASRISAPGGRAGRISDRPMLRGGDPFERIVALKEDRQALYAQADFIIQTDDMTPDQVTHQILLAFREQSAVGGPV